MDAIDFRKRYRRTKPGPKRPPVMLWNERAWMICFLVLVTPPALVFIAIGAVYFVLYALFGWLATRGAARGTAREFQ